MRYKVKPKADLDLDLQANFFAREASLQVALRFFDAADETFSLLAARPDIGWRSRVRYPGLEELRVFRVTRFTDILVLYRPLSKGVEILRVFHGSRSLRKLLRREGLE